MSMRCGVGGPGTSHITLALLAHAVLVVARAGAGEDHKGATWSR